MNTTLNRNIRLIEFVVFLFICPPFNEFVVYTRWPYPRHMFRTFLRAEPKRKHAQIDQCEAPNIQIVTENGDKHCVPLNIALQIGIIRDLMDDSESESDDDSVERKIPIPTIPTLLFEKILEYLVLHQNNPAPKIVKPIIGDNLNAVVNDSDQGFINNLPLNGDANVFDILEAANFLEIPPLVDLCLTKIAIAVRGKTLDQVREDFGIQHPTDEFYEPTQEELNLIAGRDAKDNGGGGGGESKNNV